MPLWEKEYREELDKSTPEGTYDIGNEGFKMFTGKLGYINYRVECLRLLFKAYPAIDNNMSLKEAHLTITFH